MYTKKVKNDKIYAEVILMKFRLIETRVYGIKSIEREVSFSFVKKSIDEDDFEESFIKTIYGPNGSGKTGVISSFNIYKTIALNDFPFLMAGYNSLLENLINKKTKKFIFSVSFALLDGNNINRIKHNLEISIDDNGQSYLSHEMIHLLNSRLEETTLIFESVEGEIKVNKLSLVESNKDSMSVKNNSVTRFFVEAVKKIGDEKPSINKYDYAIIHIIGFASNLVVVYGEKQDSHVGHFADWFNDNQDTLIKSLANDYMIEKGKEIIKTMPKTRCFDVVFSKDYEKYKKMIESMEKFVKLLKPDLVKIEPVKRVIDNLYIVNLEFIYKDYRVDYEFESSGLKKVCILFSAFAAAKKGNIVLIDEIDSNIHDTFLTKLIEYFAAYTSSQIICTTHNVEIMSITKTRSKSIDFLSSDNVVIPWVQSGRLSPETLYLKGRIKFIPFDLDSSEFAEVFYDE